MVIDCRFVTHILLALFNNHRLYYRLHSWLKEVPLTAEWRTEFFKSHALHFIGRSECGQVKAAGKSRKINQVIYHYQYAAEHSTAQQGHPPGAAINEIGIFSGKMMARMGFYFPFMSSYWEAIILSGLMRKTQNGSGRPTIAIRK